MNSSTAILASKSSVRRSMLANAGVNVDISEPRVDEQTVKMSLVSEGHSPRDVADALAELKANKVSSQNASHLVIGADQILEFKGRIFSKPTGMDEAKQHLLSFSGAQHSLISAVVIAENGKPVFRTVKTAKMHVRPLTEPFIDAYLDAAGPSVLECVGAYQFEGLGAQLFSKVDGDYFTVLGLPLLDVLGYLRERGYLPK